MATVAREEIFQKVRQTLVDALSVEPDEVTDDATLMGDLGAESIDFLDIVFRLEKAFGIKISQDELMPKDILSSNEYVVDRKLSPAGVAALREKMPHANLDDFAADPDIDKLAEVFTVDSIVRFVELKLRGA